MGSVHENPGRMVTLSSSTPHLVGLRASWYLSVTRRYIIGSWSSGNLCIRDRRNKAVHCFRLSLSVGTLPVTLQMAHSSIGMRLLTLYLPR